MFYNTLNPKEYSNYTPNPGHSNYLPLMWDQSALLFFMICDDVIKTIGSMFYNPIKLKAFSKLEYLDMKLDSFWNSLSNFDSK